MRFRSLSLALLVLAAAVALWLMRTDGNAAVESPAATAPFETAAPAEGKPATGPASRTAGEDPHRHEVAETPASSPAPKVRLTGRVVNAVGRAVARAVVCLDRGRPDFGGLEETGAEGTYEYTVEPGEHDLVARAEGTARGHATIQVPHGVDRFAAPTLVLPEGKVIRGRVLDAQEQPMVDIRVKAFAERDLSTVIFSAGKLISLGCEDVLTAEDGTFAMRGVEDLPYTVHPDIDSHPHLRSEPHEVKGVVADGRLVEFRLVPQGFVRGIVLDALTGRPIPRFFVMQTEVRNAEGRFEVPIGKEQKFEVEAPGYLPETENDGAATRKSGERIVRLSPDPDTATLVVFAKDEAGEPVRRFSVSWFSDLRFSFRTEEAADSGGSLRIPTVPCGTTQFWAEAEGRAPAGFAVEIARGAEKRVEVRLVGSSPVRLKGVLPDGNPAEDVNAIIEDEQGERPPWKFKFTRPQGRNPPIREWFIYGGANSSMRLFEADGLIVGLRPGRYRLILSEWGPGVKAADLTKTDLGPSGKAGAGPTPFTVAPGRTEELTVELKR